MLLLLLLLYTTVHVMGLALEHLEILNEELELCRSAKGRRQIIAGLEEIT